MQLQHLRQVELNEWQATGAMGSLSPSGTSSLQTATTDTGNAGGASWPSICMLFANTSPNMCHLNSFTGYCSSQRQALSDVYGVMISANHDA